MGSINEAITRSVAKTHAANMNSEVVSTFTPRELSLDAQIAHLQEQKRKINSKLIELKRLRRKSRTTQDTAAKRYLYVLLCTGGRYYIGQTTSITRRLKQHKKGGGSWFTREYKPLEMVEVIELGEVTQSVAAKQEDLLTIHYMTQHGIDNVRGGGLIQRDPKWFMGRLKNPVDNLLMPIDYMKY